MNLNVIVELTKLNIYLSFLNRTTYVSGCVHWTVYNIHSSLNKLQICLQKKVFANIEKGLDIWSIYLNFHGRHAEITQLSSSSTFSEKKNHTTHVFRRPRVFLLWFFFPWNHMMTLNLRTVAETLNTEIFTQKICVTTTITNQFFFLLLFDKMK